MKKAVAKVAPKKTKHGCLSEELIAEALILHRGNQSKASAALGHARCTVSARVQRSEYLKQVCDDCVEQRLDRAEDSLDDMIMERELGAVCFFLKTRGKHRGYIEDKQPATFIMKDTAKQIGKELGWNGSEDIQS